MVRNLTITVSVFDRYKMPEVHNTSHLLEQLVTIFWIGCRSLKINEAAKTKYAEKLIDPCHLERCLAHWKAISWRFGSAITYQKWLIKRKRKSDIMDKKWNSMFKKRKTLFIPLSMNYKIQNIVKRQCSVKKYKWNKRHIMRKFKIVLNLQCAKISTN